MHEQLIALLEKHSPAQLFHNGMLPVMRELAKQLTLRNTQSRILNELIVETEIAKSESNAYFNGMPEYYDENGIMQCPCDRSYDDDAEAYADSFFEQPRPDTGFEDYIEHHGMLVPSELIDDLPFLAGLRSFYTTQLTINTLLIT